MKDNIKRSIAAVMAALLGTVSVAAAPSPASAGTQATYVASPAGSGTACTAAAPCSLTGVRDKVRAVNGGMSGDIVVQLRAGTYVLSGPLAFGAADSGTNGYRVLWQNYPGEAPVISGGPAFTGGWTVHDSTKNIYKKTGVASDFRQLYVNGVMAVRARTPNLTDPDTLGSYFDTISGDVTNRQYKINKAEIAPWGEWSKVEMVTQPHWYHNRLRIAGFTTDASYAYVSFQSPENANAFKKAASYYTSNAYHFENAYEFVDAQGEWYLNTTTDVLYYKPRPGELLSAAAFVTPSAETLIQLTGTASAPVRNIEFKGLTFAYTGWNGPSSTGLVATQGVTPVGTGAAVPGAVQAVYGQNLRFIGNTFRDLGGTGLKLGQGAKDSQVVGNTFTNIMANGVELVSSKNAVPEDVTDNLLIANNTLSRIGQQYSNGIGILAYFVKNVIIEHNDLSYMPYMGIQLGGQAGGNVETGMANNMVRYNKIHHAMQLYDDGGGIYTLGRQPGTYVYENYIHDLAKSAYAMSAPVAALYMDNYSEFITAEHNVLTGIDTASGALLTYEQTGVGAMNNQWVSNGTQDQAVKDRAGVTAAYSESTALEWADSFDSGTAGSPPAGWTVTNGGGTVQVAAVPSTSDRSVLVNKGVSTSTTTSSKALSGASLSGIVTVTAKIRAEQAAGWKMAPYITDSAGVQAVAVSFDGGSIKIFNGPALTAVQAFTPGVWYDLRIVMDTNKDQFDLYIDGMRKVTDASFRNAVTNVKSVMFGIGDGHSGSFYYDRVSVLAP